MQRNHRYVGLVALAAALASLLVHASGPRSQREQASERVSADLPRSALQRRLSQTTARKTIAPGLASMAAVTDEEVGDSDSFGRNVTWLGLTNAFITLDPACPVPASPDEPCQTLAPSPAITTFNFVDAVRIKLPAKATHSLLCYWFSPVLTINYNNPTAAPVIARLRYNPTLTVENPLLDDPALIDPTTGLPFGGSLLTGMTSSERFEVPLSPGVQFTERTRDSTVCIAGLLSRRALVDTYGLTDAQAKDFFKQPTTIRLNVSGSARYVGFASLIFGLRIVGD